MFNEIDLHDLNYDDALKIFIDRYNVLYKKGERKEILVIHGYGSKRLESVPVIRTKIREYFLRNRDCVKMRIDLNQGVTYILPLKPLPTPGKNRKNMKTK